MAGVPGPTLRKGRVAHRDRIAMAQHTLSRGPW
jgi:hypothetical protein